MVFHQSWISVIQTNHKQIISLKDHWLKPKKIFKLLINHQEWKYKDFKLDVRTIHIYSCVSPFQVSARRALWRSTYVFINQYLWSTLAHASELNQNKIRVHLMTNIRSIRDCHQGQSRCKQCFKNILFGSTLWTKCWPVWTCLLLCSTAPPIVEVSVPWRGWLCLVHTFYHPVVKLSGNMDLKYETEPWTQETNT